MAVPSTSLTPIDLPQSPRSSFLAPSPPPARRRRRGRLFRLLALAVLASIAIVAFGIGTRRLAIDGWAHELYRLHDSLWLSTKGWLWTRWYPLSAVILGASFAPIALGLVGLIRGRATTSRLQVWLTRRLLARRDLHPRLMARLESSRRDSLLSGVTLLSSVIEDERRRALDALATFDDVEHAASLSRLAARLPRRAAGGADDDALVALYECSLHGHAILGPGDAGEQLRLLRAEMSELRRGDDVLVVAPTRPLDLRRSADAIARRSEQIDRERIAIERHDRGLGFDPPSDAPSTVSGRLATLVAIDVARLSHAPQIASAYFDSMRELAFVLDSGHDDDTESRLAQRRRRLQEVVAQLPTVADLRLLYALCSKSRWNTAHSTSSDGAERSSVFATATAATTIDAGRRIVDLEAATDDRGWRQRWLALRKRRARGVDEEAARLDLRQRNDVVLRTAFAVVVTVTATLLGVGAWLDYALDLSPPPLLRVVADQRILTNVRHDLAERPFLAATLNPYDRELLVSQVGGVLHRYDPATALWSSEDPVGGRRLHSADIVDLRAGCGHDQAASRSDCADPDVVWARTAQGALFARRDRTCTLLNGDSSFTSADGRPVTDDRLTSAAASADGRWLLIGTSDAGVGLYDLRHRTWVTAMVKATSHLPSPDVRHIRWWRDAFWIGTGSGLATVTPSVSSPQVDVVTGYAEVIDLDVEVVALVDADPSRHIVGDGRLLVLERRACTVTDGDCLRVTALALSDTEPAILLDESGRFPGLDLGRLSHAELQGDDVVVAGAAGIYAYDPARHAWRQLDRRPVTCLFPAQEELYAAHAGGVILIRHGRVSPKRWPVPRVEQLARSEDGYLLALTSDRQLLELREGGEVELVLERRSSGLDPARFTDAVAQRDHILFRGPDGLMVHDVRRRSYQVVAKAIAEPWLTDRSTRFVGTDGGVFALVEDGRTVRAVGIDLARLAAGDARPLGRSEPVVAPLRSARTWSPGGVLAVDGDGNVARLDARRTEELVGGRDGPPRGDRLLAVKPVDGGLVVATDAGVFRYSNLRRRWSRRLGGGLARGDYREVELAGSEVLARTADGDLVGLTHEVSLIGGRPLHMADDEIDDVIGRGSSILLAGGGWIDDYSTRERRVTRSWRLARRSVPGGPIDLVGTSGGLPVAVYGGRVWVGGRALFSRAGEVLSASVAEESVWTVRSGPHGRFLMAHGKRAAAPICIGKAPFALGARDVIDARQIRPGLIVTLTDAGLMLYSAVARSWSSIAAPAPTRLDQLHRIGGFLVWRAPDGDDVDLRLVRLAAVPEPDSCSSDRLRLPIEELKVRDAVVDEGHGFVVWLTHDGRVERWRGDDVERLRHADELTSSARRLREVAGLELPLPSSPADSKAGWRAFEAAVRSWRQRGDPSADAIDPGEDGTRLVRTSFGLGLAADHIKTAIQHDGRFWLFTDESIEVADRPPSSSVARVRRHPPVAIDDLLTTTGLYGRQDGVVVVWDGVGGRFIPAGADVDPYRDRTLWSDDRLQFQRRAGQVQKRIRIDVPEASEPGTGWTPFSLYGGRFPFDVVTTMELYQGRLYVGTMAGLAVYPRADDVSLSGMAQFVDLRRDGRGPLRAVERLGRPWDRPDVLVASSVDGAREIRAGGGGVWIEHALVDRLWLGGSSHWTWLDEGGRVHGFYLDADDSVLAAPMQLVDGRFAHDRIADAIECQGHIASLWGDRNVTVRSGVSFALDAAARTWQLDGRSTRLVCLEQDSGARGELAAGLYVMLAGGGARRFGDGSWTSVVASSLPELALRGDGRVRFERGRLRLVARPDSAPRLVFQQRALDRSWRDLSWQGDRLTIDTPSHVFANDRRVWLVTDDGLVAMERTDDDRLGVVAETLHIVSRPTPGGAWCDIRSLDAHRGTVTVRCASGEVFESTPTLAADRDLWVALADSDDPFDTLLVGGPDDGWRWRRHGRSSAILEVEVQGKPVGLSGGRFDFDDVRSLATFTPGTVELATGSGRLQLPTGGDGHVRSLRRPPFEPLDVGNEPTIVEHVAVVAAPDAASAPGRATTQLCLGLGSGGVLRIDEAGETHRSAGSCHELVARDRLWRYEVAGGHLSISAEDRRHRQVERQLVDGRFGDDVAIGLPVARSRGGFVESLVPTASGVVVLDGDGLQVGVYGPDFAGLLRGEVPPALYVTADGRGLYPSPAAMHGLDDNEQVAWPLARSLPPGARMTAIENGPAELVRVRWRGADGRPGTSLWSLTSAERALVDRAPIDVADWPRFTRGRVAWGDPSSLIEVVTNAAGVSLRSFGSTTSAMACTDKPLATIVDGSRLWVIETREVSEIELSRALAPLFGAARFGDDRFGAAGFGADPDPRGAAQRRGWRTTSNPKPSREANGWRAIRR